MKTLKKKKKNLPDIISLYSVGWSIPLFHIETFWSLFIR